MKVVSCSDDLLLLHPQLSVRLWERLDRHLTSEGCIVANRPENGGTVPNFTPLSRYCPEIYKAKPQKFN